MTNHVTIGTKNGTQVVSANAENMIEAHENGQHWVRAGVADAYQIWSGGQRKA